MGWGHCHSIHKAMRRSLCRESTRPFPRPVLINNWEATYFDFTGEKILDIARQAKELGVEMMVLDDGWFGKRDSDCSGLGDWQVNQKAGRFPGQPGVAINGLGMKFGIWMEPEMVSEDSSLYRNIRTGPLLCPEESRSGAEASWCWIFSRKEVADYIF